MQPKEKSLVWDVVRYCDVIVRTISELSESEYLEGELLRLSVERALEIIGEALRQLERTQPDMAAKLPDYKGFISLRNVIAHGYARLDHGLIWRFTQESVPNHGALAAALYSDLA